jgi:hypothetical protein
MKSWDAMKAMVGKNVDEMAQVFRKSTSLIYKWTQPNGDYGDSGALNPIDKLAMGITAAMGLGVSKADATAPIQCLANIFDMVVIEIPKALSTPKEVTEELSKVIAEFSDLTAETAKALDDGRISGKEYERIHNEVYHLCRAAMAFNQKVKESVR